MVNARDAWSPRMISRFMYRREQYFQGASDRLQEKYMEIRLIAADMDLEEELRLLNTYRSRYIAEYQDVIRVDNELWVRGVVIC